MRRMLAVVALAAPLLAALPDGGGPAFAAHDQVRRVAGVDRVATAIAVSMDAFPVADTVIVANAFGFADALAAAPLAGAYRAPVLLNPPGELDDRVAAELERLGGSNVFLLGGTAAQSSAVERALTGSGRTVRRLSGSTRFDTAAAIQREAVAKWRADGDAEAGRNAIVALGQHPLGDDRAWPDALAAGVLAGVSHQPMLLVHRDSAPQVTIDLVEEFGVQQLHIAGGEGALPQSTVDQLGVSGSVRSAGQDRYATGVLLAQAALSAGASSSTVHVVTGRSFPDALGAVPAVLAGGGVLLMVDGRDLEYSSASAAWLEGRADQVEEIVVVGGPSAVSDGSVGQVERALDGFVAPSLALEVIGDFSQPMAVRSDPSAPGRLLVAERSGRIRVVDDGIALPTPFLDLTDRVRDDGERGLLDLALAADFATSGRFFVHYSHADDGRTVVSEFRRSSGDPRRADRNETILLEVAQPASNHNGGGLAVLPDGTLLLALGDGGGSDDQFGNGQDPTTLLGGLTRLDVGTPGVAGAAAGNPYVGRAGDDRIWATGLRNPYRIDLDPVTGLLWIADVGQGSWEEIDVAHWSEPGLDYGWSTMEGPECFRASTCDQGGLTLPVEWYARSNDRCAVIGSGVHRGAIGMVRGHHFYGDLCSGEMFSFRMVDGAVAERTDWTNSLGGIGLRSITTDGAGEVYVMSTDTVWRIVAA